MLVHILLPNLFCPCLVGPYYKSAGYLWVFFLNPLKSHKNLMNSAHNKWSNSLLKWLHFYNLISGEQWASTQLLPDNKLVFFILFFFKDVFPIIFPFFAHYWKILTFKIMISIT